MKIINQILVPKMLIMATGWIQNSSIWDKSSAYCRDIPDETVTCWYWFTLVDIVVTLEIPDVHLFTLHYIALHWTFFISFRRVSFIFELSEPPAGIQWTFEQKLVKIEQMNDVELEVGFVAHFKMDSRLEMFTFSKNKSTISSLNRELAVYSKFQSENILSFHLVFSVITSVWNQWNVRITSFREQQSCWIW